MATAITRQQRAVFLGARVPGIVDDAGDVWSLHMGPEQATLSGNAYTYTTQPLQGLKALTFPNSPGVRGLSFSHTVAGGSGFVRAVLASLRSLAGSARRVRFVNLSKLETAGWWHVTDLTITVVQRDPSQEAVQASLAWTLTEANDRAVPKIGRTAPRNSGPGASPGGGTGGGGGGGTPAPKPGPPSTATRRYTVKAGDGLYSIAGDLLGDFTRWREIATLNHITNPDRLTVGQVLLIPPRDGAAVQRPTRGGAGTRPN
jgi:LysM repeat protein